MENSPETYVPHTSAYIPVNPNKLDEIPKNIPQNFDLARVEYDKAVIKYKEWTFTIYSTDVNSFSSWRTEKKFKVKVENSLFCSYTDLKEFSETLEWGVKKVKDFINNELQ